jgi:hypothetical protein
MIMADMFNAIQRQVSITSEIAHMVWCLMQDSEFAIMHMPHTGENKFINFVNITK